MAKAKKDDTVKVHYTGKLTDGNTFDTSEGRDPLSFKLGSNQVIPGFENGIIGMEVGEKKTINIPIAEAYGEYRKELLLKVDLKQLPEGVEPKVGDTLEMTNENGDIIPVRVADITETDIVLDANHPLSGQELVFDLELVSID
ncbi:MAG: peptidylprolyl isomerase [Candidatus Kapabacteria bacterium]|jgi:peptidylprolyl isomerase|nr:peptidylprolyl isomerase [Candidatus Kapabacteria bacterium]